MTTAKQIIMSHKVKKKPTDLSPNVKKLQKRLITVSCYGISRLGEQSNSAQ